MTAFAAPVLGLAAVGVAVVALGWRRELAAWCRRVAEPGERMDVAGWFWRRRSGSGGRG